MSDLSIRRALESRLAGILSPLPTVWQNRPPAADFDATAPHQKAFLLRGAERSIGLSERTTLQRGIFQVSLCYPAGKGTEDVETKAMQIQAHFAAGTVLQFGGVKVRIRGKPSIGDPVTMSPYVVPVSIRYETIT